MHRNAKMYYICTKQLKLQAMEIKSYLENIEKGLFEKIEDLIFQKSMEADEDSTLSTYIYVELENRTIDIDLTITRDVLSRVGAGRFSPEETTERFTVEVNAMSIIDDNGDCEEIDYFELEPFNTSFDA